MERNNDKNSNHMLEECLKVANMYQRKFPSIETLSSKDLLENPSDAWLFLDARTTAERDVSKIRNSIPVSDYNDTAHSSQTKLVVYCTIGYRSGLEATRLKQRYPHREIYNLDGLMAYSHYHEVHHRNNPIVNADNEPARVIHTFAKSWDYVDPKVFETTQFSYCSLPGRFLQVGIKTIVRQSQSFWFKISQCCHSRND